MVCLIFHLHCWSIYENFFHKVSEDGASPALMAEGSKIIFSFIMTNHTYMSFSKDSSTSYKNFPFFSVFQQISLNPKIKPKKKVERPKNPCWDTKRSCIQKSEFWPNPTGAIWELFLHFWLFLIWIWQNSFKNFIVIQREVRGILHRIAKKMAVGFAERKRYDAALLLEVVFFWKIFLSWTNNFR